MATFETKAGTRLYDNDWGSGQPIVFSHGWPLSADASKDQFYLAFRGDRCIAHDRRGHGRPSQPWSGNDLDTYADDLAELNLKDAVHVGHSTAGGARALYRPPRLQARGQGRAHRSDPAVDAKGIGSRSNPIEWEKRHG
jgi:non-heme chloroperoxidase